MKTTNLLLICGILVSCSKPPELERVYEEIRKSPSEYVYFYNIQTLPEEIKALELALSQTDSLKQKGLYAVLTYQLQFTRVIQDSVAVFLTKLKEQAGDTIHNPAVMMSSLVYPKIESIRFGAFPPQCYKPIPCPYNDSLCFVKPGAFIAFWSCDAEGSVQLTVNHKPVMGLSGNQYFALTGLRTVKIPAESKFNPGDSILLELPVAMKDSTSKIRHFVIQYKEAAR